MPTSADRIPSVGADGLRRFDCPRCGKLVFRFGVHTQGGPIEIPCRPACKDPATGRRTLHTVHFNEAGPEL